MSVSDISFIFSKNEGIFHLDTVSQLFSLLIRQEDWNDVEGEEKDNVDSNVETGEISGQLTG